MSWLSRVSKQTAPTIKVNIRSRKITRRSNTAGKVEDRNFGKIGRFWNKPKALAKFLSHLTRRDSFKLAASAKRYLTRKNLRIRRSAERNHPLAKNPDRSSYSLHDFSTKLLSSRATNEQFALCIVLRTRTINTKHKALYKNRNLCEFSIIIF